MNYCNTVIRGCQEFLCYNIFAMKWLLVLAIVFPFAQQPTEAPKDKGAADANRAEGAGNTKHAQENEQQPIKAVSISTQSPIPAESEGAPTATTNATSKNNTQTPEEDIRIQRELALFTGALVVV